MIRRILLMLSFVLVTSLPSFAVPMMVGAYDPVDVGVNCGAGDNSQSAACASRTSEDPLSGPGGIILKAAAIVGYIAGAAALIVIIYSGIKYVTSNGDATKMGNARGTLLNALVGLLVIALAEALLMFVVSRL